MYKNTVENNRKLFEILVIEAIQQKMELENSKYIVCYFEFSLSGFPHSQVKRAGSISPLVSQVNSQPNMVVPA